VNIAAIWNIDRNEAVCVSYGKQYWQAFDRLKRHTNEAIRRSLVDQENNNNNRNINSSNRQNNQQLKQIKCNQRPIKHRS
jgi:hypothetical protein